MRPARKAVLLGACALAAGLRGGLAVPSAFASASASASAQTPRATPTSARRPPTAAPTAIPTPVPPEREGRQNRGAAPAPDRRGARYENRSVRYSKVTRVEEVDLDRDGVFEALVEGVGTVRSLPPDIPAVGFVSRARLPFENPILSVFKRAPGGDWDLLLAAHLPQQCTQSADTARCDELLAFRSVDFRFDDRPQVALQIVRAGEPRLSETYMYRLDKGRFDTTFSAVLPRAAVEVDFGPAGITRRIAVDTFINSALPPRYRSFTLTTSYVFGERRFRIVSESVEPEWADRGVLDLSYWGLVHQPTFSEDLVKLKERQAKVSGGALGARPGGARQKEVSGREGHAGLRQAAGAGRRDVRARGMHRAPRRVPAAAGVGRGEESLGFRDDPVDGEFRLRVSAGASGFEAVERVLVRRSLAIRAASRPAASPSSARGGRPLRGSSGRR